ncbi:hypothetical protein Ddye_023122 [Dipteronia dyeriana]|uniref:Reverse transcriptase domain-containing protein n=1 Tax=Dipteronia dyeriana TaxID=168575 RepID=A0AAD9TTA7_9ROSI|nr:hypothetical protein Ddye_023122 [Dipteronia dyeriana]
MKVSESGGTSWRLIGFYGHPDRSHRGHSWTLLRRLAGLFSLPWVCIGDLNEIICDNDKRGRTDRNWRVMSDFREALEDCELKDMGFIGPKFTWRNKRNGSSMIMERLDRSFCNRGRKNLFSQYADHECSDIVNSMWKGTTRSNKMEDILSKIERCGKFLSFWNIKKICDMRGNLKTSRKALANACKADVPHFWESINKLEANLDEALDIEESVTEACLRVLNDGASVDGMNHTIISLILTLHSSTCISDYRPISLCNVIYKAIAKAVTNRLRVVLAGVISETQCAFVHGRLISDNIIIGFECIHRLKRRKRKKGLMTIKLDMAKAYDMVEWVFLEGMMQKTATKWVNLIMRCVSSVSYSFTINGEVCGNIKPTRGLRQGDPLSPFLFLFYAEVLSNLIQRSHQRGELSGFCCSRGGPKITHLFFADVSLIFTRANDKNYRAVRTILDVYGKASGEAVNFGKSVMCISPSFSALESERRVASIGIKLVDCHENYLGLP